METIQLRRKSVIDLNLEIENEKGEFELVECIATIDTQTIDFFQKSSNKGLLKALETMTKNKDNITAKDIELVKGLLGAVIRVKKTDRMLGLKYFQQFDDASIFNSPLIDILTKLTDSNLPKAKGDNPSEKK